MQNRSSLFLLRRVNVNYAFVFCIILILSFFLKYNLRCKTETNAAVYTDVEWRSKPIIFFR